VYIRMKKIVVVDLEYMRPSVGGRRSGSRSRSRSKSLKRGGEAAVVVSDEEDEEMNIGALLNAIR